MQNYRGKEESKRKINLTLNPFPGESEIHDCAPCLSGLQNRHSKAQADNWLESGAMRTQDRRKMAVKWDAQKPTQTADTYCPLPPGAEWLLLPAHLEVCNVFSCVCVCLQDVLMEEKNDDNYKLTFNFSPKENFKFNMVTDKALSLNAHEFT